MNFSSMPRATLDTLGAVGQYAFIASVIHCRSGWPRCGRVLTFNELRLFVHENVHGH